MIPFCASKTLRMKLHEVTLQCKQFSEQDGETLAVARREQILKRYLFTFKEHMTSTRSERCSCLFSKFFFPTTVFSLITRKFSN